MNVTSETLLHLTSSLKNLIGILQNRFRLTYCNEKFILNHETIDSYYPMVSFCDMPLTMASSQIKKYGSFGIGMTKEWGINNKLNPVLYIDKNSLVSADIQVTTENFKGMINAIGIHVKKFDASKNKILKKISDDLKEFTKNDAEVIAPEYVKKLIDHRETLSNLLDANSEIAPLIDILSATLTSSHGIFRYIKNYQGINPKTKKPTQYRFYDEREWRYVPSLDDVRLKSYLLAEDFKKYRGKGKKPFIENITLSFTNENIQYLLVKSRSDIPKLIKAIRGIDYLTKNSNEFDILTTKIITVDQLSQDF